MEQMIWALYMECSRHMWDDETTPGRWWYAPAKYQECNDVDLETWDNTVRFAAEQGVNMILVDVGDMLRYEKHPEIAAPDAWSKDFMRKKLDEMRALGIEPVPKLNFSTGHDTWMKLYRRMVSTPAYYQLCSDLIAEVCEVFGSPRFFHLGLDEERPNAQQFHEMTIVRGAALWWHDAYFLFDECEKHGARPWIWADYYQDHPKEFAEKMPRSVLLSNWYYHQFMDYPETNISYKRIRTYEGLAELGFDQVPAGATLVYNDNIRETMIHAKKVIRPENLKGFMATAWYNIAPKQRFRLLNEPLQLRLAREEVYPETL